MPEISSVVPVTFIMYLLTYSMEQSIS